MASSVVGKRAVSALLRSNFRPTVQVQRCIVSKELRDPDYKRVAPFPYETKNYNLMRALFDDVTHRFDENTKIIVIDGPPTGNKEAFGRYLADQLDMKYQPDADLDMFNLDEYGVDLRCLNPDIDPTMRSLDIHEWLQQPNAYHTPNMQWDIMASRYYRYVNTHQHILSTGQGVVCHRSIYSDVAFGRTILDQGWMRKEAFQYIEDSKDMVIEEFLRPHLVIYLDMEPETICANAAARCEPGEKNSPFYTPEVQANLIRNYKDLVIKPLSEHAEVLVYDWNHPDVDYESIVDDICNIDFSKYTKYHEKINDWNIMKHEWDWKKKRARFNKLWGPILDRGLERAGQRNIPEMFPHPNEIMHYLAVKEKLPSQQYAKGYNKAMGDQRSLWNLLWGGRHW